MTRATSYPIVLNDARHLAEHNHIARMLPGELIAPTGETDELLDLIAEMGDEVVIPPGTWTISSTLTIDGDQWIRAADHTSTIRYTGSGTALKIASPPNGAHHRLPNVERSVKNWDAQSSPDRSSIGVQWVNGSLSAVDVGRIQGFYVGLDVRGESAGSAYNRFSLGHLIDNMIGLRLSGDGGYANANHFHGGSISIPGSSASGVAGSRYILGTATGGTGDAPGGPVGNGNVFDGIALEGNRCEVSVELTSTYNVITGCRFEAPSPIRFTGDTAYGNVIVGGYGVVDDQGQGVEVQGNTQNTIVSGMTATPFVPWASIPA